MFILTLSILFGCEESKSQLREKGPCNPIDESHCLLPFPSDHHRADGMLNLKKEALPVNVDGVGIEPDRYNEKDGFSIGSTLYAQIPEATLSGVARWPAVEDSLTAESKTVIIDVESLQRIPHHVEREDQALMAGGEALLMLRPMIPLQYSKTYVVGIRGMVDENDNIVEGPKGFAAVRDGVDMSDELVATAIDYEELIFPSLESIGFERDTLQLAWSFTTASEENTLGTLRHMRDETLKFLDEKPVEFEIYGGTDENCDGENRTGRLVKGRFKAPLYLRTWDPGDLLERDENGIPQRNGIAEAPFMALIGCSVIENESPGKLLQYGHGIMASRLEMDSEYIHTLADDNGWVVFAGDWTGLKFEDSGAIGLTLIENPTDVVTVMDRSAQGFMELMTLTRLMRQTDLMSEEAFQQNGVQLIDPATVSFYGNSAGSILGGAYTALNPDIERAALGVGGMPFSLILTRADGFSSFMNFLRVMYTDWKDITLLMGLLQQLWDATESVGWAGINDKPALIQLGIGDGGVPTIAGHVMARGFNMKLMQPENRDIWGLETAESPFNGSAIAEWDFGIVDPDGAWPAEIGNINPHDLVRNNPAAMEQLSGFINEGIVRHHCDGPCDPD